VKLIDSLLGIVGATPGRYAPPPTYRAIGPGLLLTTTKVEAWFALRTANTDTASDEGIEEEIISVIRSAGRVLAGRECHLKLLWSTASGDDYAASVADRYTLQGGRDWAELRADRIDAVAPPKRHLFLGVTLSQSGDKDFTSLAKITAPLTAYEATRVSKKELAFHFGQAHSIGQGLKSSRLRARLATPEEISWILAREQNRTDGAQPTDELITGAAVGHLTRGRVVPMSDRLEIKNSRGVTDSIVGVLPIVDFPEEMETPGEGEWLRTLGDITRIIDSGSDDAGLEERVVVEASVRFRIHKRREAIKKLDDARGLAKEQRRSAEKGSAGETTEDISEAEFLMEDVIKDVKKRQEFVVQCWPRLIVSAATHADFEAFREATISHYADNGITVTDGADEQRELWLEMLPGDRVRAVDLSHIQDAAGFFGSLFWGGSRVGDEQGPSIGFVSGSTPGLVRYSITEAARRGESTTVAVVGLSGQGKSTLIELIMLDAVTQTVTIDDGGKQLEVEGAFGLLIDVKGDLGGVVEVCRRLDIPSSLIEITEHHRGSLDLFRSIDRREAPSHVQDLLTLLAPDSMKQVAETATLEAANRINSTHPNPSTWAVIQDLRANVKPEVRELGEAFAQIAQTPWGSLIIAEPNGLSTLHVQKGLHVVQLPGLKSKLPGDELPDPKDWGPQQRLAVGVLVSLTAHALHLSSSREIRVVPKVIGVPEVHSFLSNQFGRNAFDSIARMGRAFNTSLLLDSQDAEGIAAIPGLVEQLNTVFVTKLRSKQQQLAAAALLGLPEDDHSRALIGSLGTAADGTKLHGNFLMLDSTEDVAEIITDIPAEWVRKALDTNPEATGAAAPATHEGTEVAA
jgi:hypothetical protein